MTITIVPRWWIVMPFTGGYVFFVSGVENKLEALKEASVIALRYGIERYNIRQAVAVSPEQVRACELN